MRKEPSLRFRPGSSRLKPVAAWSFAALAAVSLAALGTGSSGAQTPVEPPPSPDGAALYAQGCQSCHGPSGEGVTGTGPQIGVNETQGAGPPLLDVSADTVELYLTTGYMPLSDPRDRPKRSDPEYDDREIDALVEHVVGFGTRPPPPRLSVDPEAGDLAEGQELFTEFCAGCHQVVGEGGVVLDGIAPELEDATPLEVAQAVRAGPFLMPAFDEHHLSDEQLDSLVRYVEYSSEPRDEGGWAIGHIGPIPEGIVTWVVAGIFLVGVARVIGKRMGTEQ